MRAGTSLTNESILLYMEFAGNAALDDEGILTASTPDMFKGKFWKGNIKVQNTKRFYKGKNARLR